MTQNCPICGEAVEHRLSDINAPPRATIEGRCCVEANIDPLEELGDDVSPKAVLTIYIHDGEVTYANNATEGGN